MGKAPLLVYVYARRGEILGEGRPYSSSPLVSMTCLYQ